MSNVVYLISSLPSLTYGQPAPISLESFMLQASFQLSESTFKKLENLDVRKLSRAKDYGNLSSAISLSEDIEADKLEIRSAKRQSRTPNIITLPDKIMEKNPLELEKYLMKILWDELDSIDDMEHFTATEVFVYKLKLQILERLDSFDKEKGLEILDKVVYPAIEKMEN
ncbi:MAG: DUF2764 family protein [Bacteroidota bacterium]